MNFSAIKESQILLLNVINHWRQSNLWQLSPYLGLVIVANWEGKNTAGLNSLIFPLHSTHANFLSWNSPCGILYLIYESLPLPKVEQMHLFPGFFALTHLLQISHHSLLLSNIQGCNEFTWPSFHGWGNRHVSHPTLHVRICRWAKHSRKATQWFYEAE